MFSLNIYVYSTRFKCKFYATSVLTLEHTQLSCICIETVFYLMNNRKSTKVACLGPGESCLYTWDNPLDKRVLMWSAGQQADKNDELVKVCACQPLLATCCLLLGLRIFVEKTLSLLYKRNPFSDNKCFMIHLSTY